MAIDYSQNISSSINTNKPKVHRAASQIQHMGFNNDARIVKDESKPLGLRYISLRHCVEYHCPLGFNATWKILEIRFGIKEGEPNNSAALIAAIEFLEADRSVWLGLKKAHQRLAHLRRKNGFPIPKIDA